jgi:polyisoprenoid-binding protein YceI
MPRRHALGRSILGLGVVLTFAVAATVVPTSEAGASGAPTITRFSPASGPPGSQIKVWITHFDFLTTTVRVGGVEADFSWSSTGNPVTKLKVTVPSGAPTGKIVVKTASGKAKSATAFTVN